MINHRISHLISRIHMAALGIKSNKDGLIIKNKEIKKTKEILELLSLLAASGYIYYSPNLESWFLKSAPDSLSPILSLIKVQSKPGKRIYRGYKKLREDQIVRTSSGFQLGSKAILNRKGGELICSLI